MDTDRAERASLNMHRLGANVPMANLCDVVSTFRPTKVR